MCIVDFITMLRIRHQCPMNCQRQPVPAVRLQQHLEWPWRMIL